MANLKKNAPTLTESVLPKWVEPEDFFPKTDLSNIEFLAKHFLKGASIIEFN